MKWKERVLRAAEEHVKGLWGGYSLTWPQTNPSARGLGKRSLVQ